MHRGSVGTPARAPAGELGLPSGWFAVAPSAESSAISAGTIMMARNRSAEWQGIGGISRHARFTGQNFAAWLHRRFRWNYRSALYGRRGLRCFRACAVYLN